MKVRNLLIIFLLCACNASHESQPAATAVDPTYGYTEGNPIRVGGVTEHGPIRERWFMDRLRGPQGQTIEYERVGSCCNFEDDTLPTGYGPLDIYKISYGGLEQPLEIYLDMYHCEAPVAPVGMTMDLSKDGLQGEIYFLSVSQIFIEPIGTSIFRFDQKDACLDYIPLNNLGDAPFAISADGGTIVYTVFREDAAHLYLSGVFESDPTPLLKDHSWNVFPTLSPQAEQIAFTRNDGENMDIYRVDANGKNVTRLTSHATADLEPAWSPNGKKIAFSSDRDGDLEIYVMNPDGTQIMQLTDNEATDMSPAWSPDGGRIVFVSDQDGGIDLHTMDADGGNRQHIELSETNDLYPVWSPDGGQIAFCAQGFDGNFDIYVVEADGTDVERLTEAPSFDCFPVWIYREE